MDELKKLFEALQKSVADMREANDARLKEIETKGAASALSTEKVEKANAAVSKMEEEIKAMKTAMSRSKAIDEAGEQGQVQEKLRKEAFRLMITKGDKALSPDQLKTLNSLNDTEGGFLVSPEMEAGILRNIAQVNAVRSVATVRTIGTNVLEQLRRAAGVTASWAGELESNPSGQTPTFGMLKITAEEMRVLIKATPNLLEDAAFDIEGYLAQEAGEAFANLEGAAFLTGTGVGKPMGMLSYASGTSFGQVQQVVTGVAAAIGDSSTVGGNGLVDALYALKAPYVGGASWLFNRATVKSIRKLKDANGVYLWSPGLGDAPATILGKPYHEDDSIAVEGAGNLVGVIADFKKFYKIVDRIGIAVTRDPFSSKPQVEFLFRKRVGGSVETFEAGKILKCST